MRGERFELDVDAMLAKVAAHPTTKLVFVCSPNNPTSNLMRRTDILRLASERWGRSLVVVDELYLDYSGEPSLSREIEDHPNLVVLRSMSKEYSLAGERLGITIAQPEVVGIFRRIMGAVLTHRFSRANVAAAITAAGIAYGKGNVQRILAERTRVTAVLAHSTVVRRIFPSDANFLLLQTVDAGPLCKLMENHGIKEPFRVTMGCTA